MGFTSEKPLVSVIMATHNGGRFIRTAVDSILGQTYDNVQFIAVNDASTDGTGDILRSYSDPRVEVYDLPVNCHAAYARNYALQFVRGDYISFLDDDDFWHERKLEKQLAVLESNEAYGACFTWASIVDENGDIRNDEDGDVAWLNKAFHTEIQGQKEYLMHFLTKGNCIHSGSSLIRTEILRRVGGQNMSLIQLHDFDHWVRLLSVTDAYMLCEELTFYRRIKDGSSLSSATQKNRMRTENEDVYICTHFFDYISDERFAELFRNDFQEPSASSPEALLCEKAFLLRKAYCGDEPAKQALQSLLSNDTTAELLREKYQYTPIQFYKDNLPKRYMDASVYREIQQIQTELQCKEGHIELLLQSERDLLAEKAKQAEQIEKLQFELSYQAGMTEQLRQTEAELCKELEEAYRQINRLQYELGSKDWVLKKYE